MTARVQFDPACILKALRNHGVRFVVIGGVAADVHGCGWSTFDLDIVVEASQENLRVLAAALGELQASYEDPAGRTIVPTLERLASLQGPQLLRTQAGRLDVLKNAGGETYETLAEDALDTGRGFRVASLEALRRMKTAAGRPKDREGLVLIEQALQGKA